MRSLGIIRQSIRMSLQNIKSNKMRSFLTMLGIVIGVAAVIGLITIVEGATSMILGTFSELGTGTMSINAPGTALHSGLSESDLETISQIEGIESLSPSMSDMTYAVYGDTIYENVSLVGESLSYYIRNRSNVSMGRIFNSSEMDGNTNVCLVDSTFVSKVLRGADPIGKQVKVAGYTYQVIGVIREENSISNAMMDTSNQDGEVYIPYKNFMTMKGSSRVTAVTAYLSADADIASVESELRATLNGIFNNTKNSFNIFNMQTLMDQLNSITGMMSIMLGGIAGISLLVGGIGIMNMMLVSVTERTKEIGLRKALGAEPIRIQMQFLIESITLSLLGGFIGILLGILIAYVGTKLMKVSFVISYGAIALGAGFSIAVGVIFGWMPAMRASKLNPIDALRSE